MATSAKKTAASDARPLGAMPTAEDLRHMVEKFKWPGLDVDALLEWQRKDMEALAEAQRQTVEGLQALAARRNEILKEQLAQWQAAMAQAADPKRLSARADAAQQNLQKAVDNFRELAQMEAQAHANSWKVMQNRMQENLGNLSKLLQSKPAKKD